MSAESGWRGSLAQLNAEEVSALLVAGAQAHGTNSEAAAVHLLIFTDLPGRPAFREHLRLIPGMPGLLAIDWLGAVGDPRVVMRASSSTRQLLALASALAGKSAVRLPDACAGLGHANARRVAEAVLIATGYGDWYQIIGTAAVLDQYEKGRPDVAR